MPKVSFAPWQWASIINPHQHFAMFGGVATGKTFTGSHFAIHMIRHYPELTGFIGANNYDQMSQATLRELFYWLDEYGFEYVSDRMPPPAWREKRKFKDYHNILSVRNSRTGKVTYVFTRVLSDGNAFRGVEFSWYWIDETRDTPQDTHDVILSRMRESGVVKGLLTSTTAGEDWAYNRFVLGNMGDGLYGSMHVPTINSVKLGIITESYFNTMKRSYSPLMALQELDAQHVNVKGGRAYYSSSDRNKKRRAPWGDNYPSVNRPLIIGCDFNFTPAPCVWMVGQRGPDLYGPDGVYYGDCVHWFGEISLTEASTVNMTTALLARYPGFFYRIFGDASGNRGTTSNAGEHDFAQIAMTLDDAGAMYSIDVDQANPFVRDRVENMNAMFCNAMGEVRQTYDPVACPLFDGDIKSVGWKDTIAEGGRGKLHPGGDDTTKHLRTHATDGAGYAVWKEFPPGQRARIIESNESSIRAELVATLGSHR